MIQIERCISEIVISDPRKSNMRVFSETLGETSEILMSEPSEMLMRETNMRVFSETLMSETSKTYSSETKNRMLLLLIYVVLS